jgi:hypothetical protein
MSACTTPPATTCWPPITNSRCATRWPAAWIAAAQHADLRAEPERHAPSGRHGERRDQSELGFEDRDACLRIPESDAKNLRIEYRLAGADANPYLVLAAILVGWSMVWNQARNRSRPQRRPQQRHRLSDGNPRCGARDAASAQLRAGLGAEFVDVYCENKRQDHLAFMQEISAREYRWYL